MAVIDINPLILKDVLLLIGGVTGDDYRKHVDAVTFTPSSSAVTWTGLGLNTHTSQSVATWVCVLNYAQDWETEGSLSAYLFEHEGETVEMTFQPRSGSGPSFTANVVITPGVIGGTVNAYAVTSVTLGSDKPVLVPAA